MKLVDIAESNSSSILKWAIDHNAKFKKDLGLADIISDDMHYILTFDDVNFLELYRLTEIYRTKLKIIRTNEIRKPSDQYFEETFQGINDKGISFGTIAKAGIEKYINIIKQIDANRKKGNFESLIDNLLIPMICRTFSIQIPFRFIDLIFAASDQELNSIFNNMYPETLNSLIDRGGLGFENQLILKIIKTIGIKPYEPKTVKYLDITKFNFLKKNNKEHKFYDPVLLSFEKKSKLTGKIIKFSFFKSNQEELKMTLKRLKKMTEPFEFEFAIQIPLEYMQQIMNNYSSDIIDIRYVSSFEMITGRGFDYNQIVKIRDYENEIDEPIDLYGARLHEAALENTAAVTELFKNALGTTRDQIISLIDIFSLLPSVYTTQITIKVSAEDFKKLMNETNPFIKSIFIKMSQQLNLLKNDIDKI